MWQWYLLLHEAHLSLMLHLTVCLAAATPAAAPSTGGLFGAPATAGCHDMCVVLMATASLGFIGSIYH